MFSRRFVRLSSTNCRDFVTPQSSNRVQTWSKSQLPKEDIFKGPKFTQIDLAAQPNPLAAIDLIEKDPVRVGPNRNVNCSGDGPLGHPKVFINLV